MNLNLPDFVLYVLVFYDRFWTRWAGMLSAFLLRMLPSSVASTLNTGLRGICICSLFSVALFVFLIPCLSYHVCLCSIVGFDNICSVCVCTCICMLMYIERGWMWDRARRYSWLQIYNSRSVHSSLTFSPHLHTLSLSHTLFVILLDCCV